MICPVSVRALGDFQEVVAELRFDRTVYDVQLTVEDDVVEFLDHLAGAKLAEVAALLALLRGGRPDDVVDVRF